MATLMKWKIDPTIGLIGPKIKALSLMVKDFMAIYLFSGIMADISHYGNHNETED